MPPRALLLFELEIRVIVMPFYGAVMALWTGFREILKQDMNQKRTKTIRLSLFIKCRWPDSNRHGNYSPKDFKSFASANSATPANMCTPDPL